MTAENKTSLNADKINDAALHDEIKFRAYELYGNRQNPVEFKLQAELPRVAYALSQIQKHCEGEIPDTRAVRAAQVYLRALISYVRRDLD
jgi:hypothetical protein